jgi:hypothetical protein
MAMGSESVAPTEEQQRYPRRKVLPHPGDTREYLISHDLIRRIEGAGAYDEDLITELRRLKSEKTEPSERVALALLIANQEVNVNSPVPVCRVRLRLHQIALEHPGTWISVFAKVGLAVTYSPGWGEGGLKLQVLHEVLTDLDKVPLDSSDPFLQLWPMSRRAGGVGVEPGGSGESGGTDRVRLFPGRGGSSP